MSPFFIPYFCHMRSKLLLLLLLGYSATGIAQEKWDLRKCVDYAMANNITVKQNDVQAQIALITYKKNVISKYPTLNFTNNIGGSFGLRENPTTGTLENQNFLSVGFNAQSSVDIFNFYSKRNQILASQWDYEAAVATTGKLKNDIALTVANAYLQILLAREQEKIAGIQLQQTQSSLINIQKLVRAGSLPELNLAEIESEVARDSANLISAKGAVTQDLLVLKAYMNIDASQPFEIDEPAADKIPVENIADLQPDAVYVLAIANMPQQKVNDFKMKSAERNVAAARGNMYPTFSIYGGLGSNYVYFRTPVYAQKITGYSTSGLVISNGAGGFTDVQRPITVNGNRTGYLVADGFGKQLKSNFGQSIGISISVPLFNGWSSRSIWEKAKLNVETIRLQKLQDDQNTKQDIYQAYNAAIVALEKFNASKKAVSTAERSYDFANRRFNVGMLTTIEMITDQNNLFRARLEYVLAQFDYVFKMKVLEFYKGQGLKL